MGIRITHVSVLRAISFWNFLITVDVDIERGWNFFV